VIIRASPPSLFSTILASADDLSASFFFYLSSLFFQLRTLGDHMIISFAIDLDLDLGLLELPAC
jgi:hypothetical protein